MSRAVAAHHEDFGGASRALRWVHVHFFISLNFDSHDVYSSTNASNRIYCICR
ncbi:unnamed protein product [Periconia digitata]|uniref:Uncharacterized protein n=1 Tax=Periconia digitata TaxID=1303443 RepID=A0A9W4UMY8_9PLEO|nr:unnamed protein product [Periconia digitata]